ncbi:unnamed protein product [Adineta ricciae]|uniref:Cornifelin-like protein n=1 Tax=Adineta ricciae TaxID=249248 RepID=A0A814VI41_ADIRI|nr:unnamed protein product [Adineta ricciae]CAF1188413.1 unnamed protein product [Adineta ricciae]
MASRADSRYSSELDYNSGYSKNYQQPTDGYQYNPWDFENPWAHGLCSCTDNCDESCYGIWCFPCFVCHLAWRMNESCWITFFLPGHLAVLRTKMRTAFRIHGTYFSDFLASQCCPCCTAIQMAGELRFRRVIS